MASRKPARATSRHRGAIERVQAGPGFLVVAGWAARDDGSGPRRPLLVAPARSPAAEIAQLWPRPGGGSESTAFRLDLAAAPDEALTLVAGGGAVATHAAPPEPFAPEGAIEEARADGVAGWVFHPGAWTPGAPVPRVELALPGGARLPLPVTLPRPELPFASARMGRPFGFRLEAPGLVAPAGATVTLLVDGAAVATALLEAPLAPPPEASAEPAAAPDGFLDFAGHAAALGGWLLGGWVRTGDPPLPDAAPAVLRLGRRDAQGEAALAWHGRPDVAGFGTGLLAFLPGGPEAGDRPEALLLALGQPRRLPRTETCRDLDEPALLEAARHLAAGAPALAARLRRPVFAGRDTLADLPFPLQLELDLVAAAPGAGTALLGWMLDPWDEVRSLRLRAGAFSASLDGRVLAHDRPDIRAAFGARHALEHDRWGFVALAPGDPPAGAPLFLELEGRDGAVGFKPVPRPRRAGIPELRRLLDPLVLAADAIAPAARHVLSPLAVATTRARLAVAAPPAVVEAGPPPASPWASVVVPLFGRLDWMLHQCAQFSADPAMAGVELIYVLDDPPRRRELLDLAQSCWRRFGVPLRLALPAENRGFAPASNAGLRLAGAAHVCFLNSDVLPGEPGWLRALVAALEADPSLGAVGATLLFEDGTVQHAGLEFRRLPDSGGFPFPQHPGKGSRRAAHHRADAAPRRVAAVTGACLAMRRTVATELGGFCEDYAVGDFEDADLCLRLRARGLGAAVHDGVALWHLERQSQGAPGSAWRRNLTLANAATFDARWGHLFPGPAAGPLRLS